MKRKTEKTKLEMRSVYTGVKELAASLGCSREHLSRVLHGRRTANRHIARALADLGITAPRAASL